MSTGFFITMETAGHKHEKKERRQREFSALSDQHSNKHSQLVNSNLWLGAKYKSQKDVRVSFQPEYKEKN